MARGSDSGTSLYLDQKGHYAVRHGSVLDRFTTNFAELCSNLKLEKNLTDAGSWLKPGSLPLLVTCSNRKFFIKSASLPTVQYDYMVTKS